MIDIDDRLRPRHRQRWRPVGLLGGGADYYHSSSGCIDWCSAVGSSPVMSEGMSTTEPAGQPIAGATTKPMSAAAALMSSSLPAHESMTYQERRMSGQVAFGYETGRRRTSSFGSYTRVVVVAVDPSDNARQAFDCEFFSPICVLSIGLYSSKED